MRIHRKWGLAFVAITALAALAACGRGDGPVAGGDERTVQIYEVPPARLRSMEHALGDVLGSSKTGSVSSSDGRLVVLAPTSTQASIGKAIETLSHRPEDAGP